VSIKDKGEVVGP